MGRRGQRYSFTLRAELISNLQIAIQSGARLNKAAAIAGITARTYQRWLSNPKGEDLRKGPNTKPSHALSVQDKEAVIQMVNRPEYRNLSPEQIVAKAATNGEYIASERTIRRVLKEANLASYRERAKAAQPAKPREFQAFQPLEILTWDITYLRSSVVRGQYFYLYLFIDIWSRRIVGYEVHEEQTAELASELLRDICLKENIETKTVLHADNGGAMRGSTMLATMQDLGIIRSFSRPRVSDDNPYVESFFRHLKYAPHYPSRGFGSIEEARNWVTRFVTWYNSEHLHSAIAFVTPDARHSGEDFKQLEKRRETYAEAKNRNPRRWSGATRTWSRPEVVMLNPDRTIRTRAQAEKAA